jgi:hypothetical protein
LLDSQATIGDGTFHDRVVYAALGDSLGVRSKVSFTLSARRRRQRLLVLAAIPVESAVGWPAAPAQFLSQGAARS